MSLAGTLGRTTLYPWLQRHRYPGAEAHWQCLRGLEFADSATLERHGIARRARLLRHALAHVPYYRERIAGPAERDTSPQAWESLPILTKAMLRQHLPQLIADTHAPGQLLANASGGSTGSPVRFYQDSDYWDQARAAQWLMEGWWGLRRGERTAALWGADRDWSDLGWKERLANRVTGMRLCNVFHVGLEQLEKFANELRSWKPALVVGYASALHLFAEFLLAHPHLQIRPRAVKSSAEALAPETRRLAEAAFQAPVFDFYGSREVNNLAAECAAHRGMHANALTRHLEIVDEHGHSVPPGVPGRILVTDYSNYAMPMLRYENEDIGIWSPRGCACGRSLPLIERVVGRKSDFIRTARGEYIHGEYFTHWFYELPEVRTFQLRQAAVDRVELEVVLAGRSANPALIPGLQKRLRETMGPGVDCAVRAVAAIDRPANGKHRFTISMLDQAWTAALPVAPPTEAQRVAS